MYIYLNVCKQVTDVKLLVLHSNTWNYLTELFVLDNNTWNHLTEQKNELRLLINVINKMCLQITYIQYIKRSWH